jgi:YndJ-like protein
LQAILVSFLAYQDIVSGFLGLAIGIYVPLTYAYMPGYGKQIGMWSLLAGWPALIGLYFRDQIWGWYLILPWVAWQFSMVIRYLPSWWRNKTKIVAWVNGFAHGYILIASLALLVFIGNWTILNFSGRIVQLTAIHFHYAGWIAPMAWLSAQRFVAPFCAAMVGRAICINIPFTAIGITATQNGFGPWIETAGSVLMSLTGLGIAGVLGHAALVKGMQNWLWSATCLSIAMFFAFLYGTRVLIPLEWLNWSVMWSTHGTLNALGFAGLWILGLRSLEQK